MNFALDILIKSTTLLLVSGLLIFILQRQSATLKHWVLSLTMVGLLLLPLATWLIPDWEWSTISYTQPEFIETEAFQEHFVATSEQTSVAEAHVIKDETPITPLVEVKTAKSTITWNVPQVLFFTWLVGFCILQFRLWVGVGFVQRITKKGTIFKHSEREAILAKAAIPQNVAVLTSSFINTPMTWGFVNPKILLPTAAVHWKAERLNLVLTHELAHIQRKDYLLHVITLIVSSLYWFNPLVWVAKSHQLIEREKACDEYVLNMGISPTSYAEQLVTMTKRLMNSHPLVAAHSLPMAQPSQMKQRILAILQFQKSDFDPYKKWSASFLFVALLLSLSTVSVYAKKAVLPISITEEGKLNVELPAFMNTEKTVKPEPKQVVKEKEVIEKEKEEPKAQKQVISKLDAPKIDKIVVEMEKLPELESLPVTSTTTSPKVEETKSMDMYGEWQEDKKTYRIWTTGQFTYTSHYPFFYNLSEDAIIIIEVTKNGKKERLIYSRVLETVSFLLPTSKKEGIKETQVRNGRDRYISIPLEKGVSSVYSVTNLKKGDGLLILERNNKRIFYQSKRVELDSGSDLVWFDYPIDDTFYKWKRDDMLNVMIAIVRNQDNWSDLTNSREKWQGEIKGYQTLINDKIEQSKPLMERHRKAVEKIRNQTHEAATQKLSALLATESADFEGFKQLDAATKSELKTLFPTIAQQFLRRNGVTYSEGYARLKRSDKVQLINFSLTFNEQVEQSEQLQSVKKSQFVGLLEDTLEVFRTYSVKSN